MLNECLESSEYFALLGAAQLNSGLIAQASESLERSLLLDPDNGSAQIDYSQALYESGQLFSALELNRQLLGRQDLPANLRGLLLSRNEEWLGQTKQLDFQLDVLAGYDSNLNGAPTPDQITLTLSGESVILPLNPDFKAISGAYATLRLGGRYRELAADHQTNWTTQIRGRFSQDSDSDLLQIDSRYAYIKPSRERSWQVDAGVSNLFFGGDALYTAIEGRARYQARTDSTCKPYYSLALQHQLFHDQSSLNALESKGSLGMNCPLGNSFANQLVTAEVSVLMNKAANSGRPGGDRGGWQANIQWQYPSPIGLFLAQLNYTSIEDRDGYSPLLVGGTERWLERSYALLQFRRPVQVFGKNTTFMTNIYHQDQRSNIELFRTEDTTFEMGLSLSF
ncbi:MAG: hypothetical protein DHS20C12_04440 [Pseudohongiella sp.]|nr:MAG: hypothetical protein DHS20C12_04440 [Pseudohongiella sp.]